MGAVGGLVKFSAGLLLVYYVGVFAYAARELGRARERSLAEGTVEGAEGALIEGMNNLYSFLDSHLMTIILVSLAWIAGSLLLARDWEVVMARWPWRVKVAFRAAEVLSTLLVLLAIAYTARPFLGHIGGLEDLKRALEGLELAWALPFLFGAPLALPLVRGLLVLLYPAGGSRVGASLFVLGGMIYGYGAFEVYRMFRPSYELRAEILQALSGEITEPQLLELLSTFLR
ncbi:MAG: hypothetical protein N3F67_06375, partial [Acidilobaceae archaeon]|nr:hypothetical protein [Acidilobaceae archaeon]